MGWSDCDTHSQGRRIGYAHAASCDHPGCTRAIDRGLAYACGGDHGAGELFCEGYFCGDHLMVAPDTDGGSVWLCPGCYEAYAKAATDDPGGFPDMARDLGL
jgi:hypothetical protein